MSNQKANYAGRIGENCVRQYLRRFSGLSLGVPAAQADQIPDLPDHLVRLLLRVEEYENPLRDEVGRWDFNNSENFKRRQLLKPEVDLFVESLKADLPDSVDFKSKWPGNKEFAVCLTHDVDSVSTRPTIKQLVRRTLSIAGDQSGWTGSPLRRYAIPLYLLVRESLKATFRSGRQMSELEKCVALEKSFEVLSSYLFTLYPCGRKSIYDCVYELDDELFWRGRWATVAEAAKDLIDEGFDVGLHGSYFSALDGDVFGEEFGRLTASLDHPVTTTRQHYLHWDIRKTPNIHSDAGIKCDSTLGFSANVGFRAGTSMPFFMFDLDGRRQLDLLQVPLIIQDVGLFWEGGLGLDLDAAKEITLDIMGSIREVGGVLTVLFHPEQIDGTEGEYYTWLLNALSNENVWITNLAEINRHWRNRADALGYG